ncbi:MAG: preprotein translocase subunit SecE [Zetaproteobacteria bacterium CG_4_9_14_3_um_filter_49_83]|nr:MAG: preprotein translocase subunit SecE [Zetaproteobacteria bacterium CG1_02_49_23]PIQ30779.1 MAG: preprotein translocase subunit SecE [Zetaproteobacteria bacterium CG17_big_fil_post_rev_8_21_14_2_50_50_13]PIV29468.1 MAG: preprotein translocase subunit SecE [Zetaproteobacteria bacterium CG02_land_8_20_14_3_00_50_9]PIY56706.1 MAG: preprotein translocase subunit SecE [Zetaproteobacteria bacterium CG_4_10_14_0_8_um_filter_49_80]PJA36268.1 MAG: preprotein translocase subunit SecE [Zetaproteobac
MSATSITRFMTEVRAEARKIVWPERRETIQATIMVVVMVLVLSLFLWAIDSVFSSLVQAVI